MKGELQSTLTQKLNDSLVADIPRLTHREIRLPAVPGKALAVIGMRRSGKTCFLSQCMADLLAAGAPRESLVLMNFEDDRLSGMDASDLSFLLETYYQRHPEFRDHTQVTLFLDEIQLVSGWETSIGSGVAFPQVKGVSKGSVREKKHSAIDGNGVCRRNLTRHTASHHHPGPISPELDG